MDKIKVIIKRPDEEYGHMTWISNTLENLQRTVGGPIEAVRIAQGILMICNEEGKIRALEPNFWINKNSVTADRILGTVIICGEDLDDFSDVMIDMPTWKKLLKLWGN